MEVDHMAYLHGWGERERSGGWTDAIAAQPTASAWGERKGITSLGRDAQALTFSVVIPARYAALRFITQEKELTYRSLRVDMARAALSTRGPSRPELCKCCIKSPSCSRLGEESHQCPCRCGGRQRDSMPDFNCQVEADQRGSLKIGVGDARGYAPTIPTTPMTCTREARLKGRRQ
jgi:hypothetical protein